MTCWGTGNRAIDRETCEELPKYQKGKSNKNKSNKCQKIKTYLHKKNTNS